MKRFAPQEHDYYDEIIREFLRQMAAVRRPLPDYIEALKTARKEIDIALVATKEDMEARG